MSESKFNTESLEIDDHKEHNDCGDETAKVRSIFSVERVLDGHHLVGLGQERMEKCDDGTFEFGILLSLDGDRGETLPQDDLADVGGDEKGNTVSKTVALLEELVKELHNDSGKSQLKNNGG